MIQGGEFCHTSKIITKIEQERRQNNIGGLQSGRKPQHDTLVVVVHPAKGDRPWTIRRFLKLHTSQEVVHKGDIESPRLL